MSVLDDFQQQVSQAGASAAQGALQQVQLQLPGVVEQASQQVQAQLPAIQQAAAPAVRDLGHEGGAAVREGATGFDTATLVGGGLAIALVVGGIIYAATRAGTARERGVGAIDAYFDAERGDYITVDGVRYTDQEDALGHERRSAAASAMYQGMSTDKLRSRTRAGDRGAQRVLARREREAPFGGIFASREVREAPAKVSRSESASRRAHWGGRHTSWSDAHEWSGELEVTNIPLDRGGYTKGKYPQYFGVGEPLYSVQSDDGQVDFHIRANGKVAAKAEVRRCYPHAKVV